MLTFQPSTVLSSPATAWIQPSWPAPVLKARFTLVPGPRPAALASSLGLRRVLLDAGGADAGLVGALGRERRRHQRGRLGHRVLQHALDDRVAVDGVRHRLAGPHVVQRRVLDVDQQVVDAERVLLDERVLRLVARVVLVGVRLQVVRGDAGVVEVTVGEALVLERGVAAVVDGQLDLVQQRASGRRCSSGCAPA